jgi:hypothetical protein
MSFKLTRLTVALLSSTSMVAVVSGLVVRNEVDEMVGTCVWCRSVVGFYATEQSNGKDRFRCCAHPHP